jgi:hypothetical protein
VRDLVRTRADLAGHRRRMMQRIGALLHRHGRIWRAPRWTCEHRAWLDRQSFAEPALQAAPPPATAATIPRARTHPSRRNRQSSGQADHALKPHGKRTLSDQPPSDLQELDRTASYEESWARMRMHLPLPPGPGRPMRAESEYHRLGPSPTWPPTTFTAPKSSAGASRLPASSRSPRSWIRSCRPCPTRRPGGSSGSWTTAPRIGTGRRKPASATPTPTPRWSTCPSTPPGSTRSRSTSPLFSAS